MKCPTGTYSDSIGNILSSECISCGEGTFNNEEGASACKECSVNFYCPVGSSLPLNKESLSSNSNQ